MPKFGSHSPAKFLDLHPLAQITSSRSLISCEERFIPQEKVGDLISYSERIKVFLLRGTVRERRKVELQARVLEMLSKLGHARRNCKAGHGEREGEGQDE